jgi:peptidoglycan/LPS O-acetylase OafA/YrhL
MPRARRAAAAHGNAFDFIRFVAASMVLASHEYAVLGRGGDEPFVHLTSGFASFGTLGVDVFFVVSGCLVTASIVRSGNVPFFVASRGLRILPALCVALLVSVLVIGAAATTLPLTQYLRDPATWRYVSRGILLHDLQWTLPGVFVTNRLPDVVNGSLWSLWPEVQMYGVVASLALLAALARVPRRHVLAAGMASIALVALLRHPDLAGRTFEGPFLTRLAPLFAFGALLGLAGWRARIGWPAFVLALALAVLARHTALFVPAFDAAVALGVIGIAHAPLGPLQRFGRYGDWSYGIYVYAFPVQQLVALRFPELPLAAHFALAYPAVLLLGAASWHVVEAPALRLKAVLRGRAVAPLAAAQPRG